MKIAVSSTGPELSDLVDPRFGRCRYYIIADTETPDYDAVVNTGAGAQ